MELVSERINFLNMLKTTLYIELGDLSPKNKNKVYGVVIDNKKVFFSSKLELYSFIRNNNIDRKDIFKVEYIGDWAGYDNVIKVIKSDSSQLYSIVDNVTCFKHNKEKSLKLNSSIWEFKYENITEYYKALNMEKEKQLIRK